MGLKRIIFLLFALTVIFQSVAQVSDGKSGKDLAAFRAHLYDSIYKDIRIKTIRQIDSIEDFYNKLPLVPGFFEGEGYAKTYTGDGKLLLYNGLFENRTMYTGKRYVYSPKTRELERIAIISEYQPLGDEPLPENVERHYSQDSIRWQRKRDKPHQSMQESYYPDYLKLIGRQPSKELSAAQIDSITKIRHFTRRDSLKMKNAEQFINWKLGVEFVKQNLRFEGIYEGMVVAYEIKNSTDRKGRNTILVYFKNSPHYTDVTVDSVQSDFTKACILRSIKGADSCHLAIGRKKAIETAKYLGMKDGIRPWSVGIVRTGSNESPIAWQFTSFYVDDGTWAANNGETMYIDLVGTKITGGRLGTTR